MISRLPSCSMLSCPAVFSSCVNKPLGRLQVVVVMSRVDGPFFQNTFPTQFLRAFKTMQPSTVPIHWLWEFPENFLILYISCFFSFHRTSTRYLSVHSLLLWSWVKSNSIRFDEQCNRIFGVIKRTRFISRSR